MDVKLFFEAFWDEIIKVTTAFVTWGLGVVFMILYCFFLVWLQKTFGLYLTIVGALFFLTVAFFLIDLWWSYNRFKHIKRMKDIG
ncbi:hypothetical protein Tfer_0690 [Thermincola ferriacetica]|uniref:Uncharacterized protein n=1 Tax=Thermincola ferriacetica TaxID=281456 RepID=A0A0L6W570_9FIRM|nr:hypothetical protein [Thermincola ferriacetica]KNZ70508.1 hypothetical protein Tfer_0690 [Thermincola ferriacetica]